MLINTHRSTAVDTVASASLNSRASLFITVLCGTHHSAHVQVQPHHSKPHTHTHTHTHTHSQSYNELNMQLLWLVHLNANTAYTHRTPTSNNKVPPSSRRKANSPNQAGLKSSSQRIVRRGSVSRTRYANFLHLSNPCWFYYSFFITHIYSESKSYPWKNHHI